MCYIQKQILEKPNPSLSFPIFLMMLDPLRCSDDFCALIFFTLPILYFKIIKNFGHFFIIYNYYHLKNHPPCPNEMTIPPKKKLQSFRRFVFFSPNQKTKTTSTSSINVGGGTTGGAGAGGGDSTNGSFGSSRWIACFFCQRKKRGNSRGKLN